MAVIYKLYILFQFLGLSSLAFSQSSRQPQATAKHQHKVGKVAIVLNLSESSHESNKVESIWIRRGMEMALERLGKGATDKKNPGTAFEFFDDQGTAEGAIAVASLISKRSDISLVVGGYSSLTAVPLATRLSKKPLIQVFAGAVEATPHPESQMSLVGTNEAQGKTMAAFAANSLGVLRVCQVIESDDGFSLAVLKGANEKLSSLNAETKVFMHLGHSDEQVAAALQQCYLWKARAIMVSGRTHAAKLILSQHLKLHPETPLIASDGWGDLKEIVSDSSTNQTLASKLSQVYVAYFWDAIPRSKLQIALDKRMVTAFGEPICTIVALGYDAIILANSVANKRIPTKSVRKFASSLSRDLTLLNPSAMPLRQTIFKLGADARLLSVQNGKQQ